MVLGFFFFGIIFIAFGTGLKLNELIENKLDGFWYLGFGFLLLIIGIIILNRGTCKL